MNVGRPTKDGKVRDTWLKLRISTHDKNKARINAAKEDFESLSDYIIHLIKNDDPKNLKK